MRWLCNPLFNRTGFWAWPKAKLDSGRHPRPQPCLLPWTSRPWPVLPIYQAGIILLPASLNSSASLEESKDNASGLSLKPHLCGAFCFMSWPFLSGESVSVFVVRAEKNCPERLHGRLVAISLWLRIFGLKDAVFSLFLTIVPKVLPNLVWQLLSQLYQAIFPEPSILEGQRLGVRLAWVQITSSLLFSCVTLGKRLLWAAAALSVK